MFYSNSSRKDFKKRKSNDGKSMYIHQKKPKKQQQNDKKRTFTKRQKR